MELSCDGVAGPETLEAASVVNAAGLYADEVAALFGARFEQRFTKGSYFRVRRNLVRHLVGRCLPVMARSAFMRRSTSGGASASAPTSSRRLTDRLRGVDEGRRGAFLLAARRYLPSLTEADLAADTCGIRPKVEGGDFIIRLEGPWFTCSNRVTRHHGMPRHRRACGYAPRVTPYRLGRRPARDAPPAGRNAPRTRACARRVARSFPPCGVRRA